MIIDDSKKNNFFINPPRTGILKKYFDNLITAKKNVPNYYQNIEQFKFNKELYNFSKKYLEYTSDFDKHAQASIPFIFEETMILYYTILKYLNNGGNIISIDAANGSAERTLVSMSDKIKSLFTTANHSNIEIFKKKPVKNCYYFEGANKDVLSYIKNNEKILKIFNDGFDFFIELVGFQMYGKERELPIKYFKQILKKDGISIFFEKNSHSSREEFLKREKQKNELFKTKFFSKQDINEKNKEVLSIMDNQLVTKEELIAAISKNYKYIVHIWNSGNFNIFVASDNKNNLERFIKIMPSNVIDEEFVYEKNLPKIIKGDLKI